MKLPTHNPDTDGNRFDWILEQSKRLREQSRSAAVVSSRPALFGSNEQRILDAHDAAVESEEVARFRQMRTSYGRKGTAVK